MTGHFEATPFSLSASTLKAMEKCVRVLKLATGKNYLCSLSWPTESRGTHYRYLISLHTSSLNPLLLLLSSLPSLLGLTMLVIRLKPVKLWPSRQERVNFHTFHFKSKSPWSGWCVEPANGDMYRNVISGSSAWIVGGRKDGPHSSNPGFDSSALKYTNKGTESRYRQSPLR